MATIPNCNQGPTPKCHSKASRGPEQPCLGLRRDTGNAGGTGKGWKRRLEWGERGLDLEVEEPQMLGPRSSPAGLGVGSSEKGDSQDASCTVLAPACPPSLSPACPRAPSFQAGLGERGLAWPAGPRTGARSLCPTGILTAGKPRACKQDDPRGSRNVALPACACEDQAEAAGGRTDPVIVSRGKSGPGERGWQGYKVTLPRAVANLVSGLLPAPWASWSGGLGPWGGPPTKLPLLCLSHPLGQGQEASKGNRRVERGSWH